MADLSPPLLNVVDINVLQTVFRNAETALLQILPVSLFWVKLSTGQMGRYKHDPSELRILSLSALSVQFD